MESLRWEPAASRWNDTHTKQRRKNRLRSSTAAIIESTVDPSLVSLKNTVEALVLIAVCNTTTSLEGKCNLHYKTKCWSESLVDRL